MMTDAIYGRDFRSELDIDTKDLLAALDASIRDSKTIAELVLNFQRELINKYNAQSQCTVTLLSTIRGICALYDDVSKKELLELDPIAYAQNLRLEPLKKDLKNIYMDIRIKFSFDEIFGKQEIDGTERDMIIA